MAGRLTCARLCAKALAPRMLRPRFVQRVAPRIAINERSPSGGPPRVVSSLRSQQRENFVGLTAIEAAPPSWTVTLAPGKDPGEVALVNKAAELGNIGKLPVRVL